MVSLYSVLKLFLDDLNNLRSKSDDCMTNCDIINICLLYDTTLCVYNIQHAGFYKASHEVSKHDRLTKSREISFSCGICYLRVLGDVTP